MSLIANGAGEQPTGFYNGVATTSLRMDNASDPNLNITNSGAPTLNTKGTLSFWYKRGIQGSGTGQHQYLIHTGTGTADNTHMDLKIETGDALSIGAYGTTPFSNSRLLRDASAWYHIVVAFDSTSGTASERLIKVYVNGVAQTGTFGAVAQNQQFPWINASQAIYIGRHASVNRPMDGYLAEWNLIDGQALAPTSFGETKNGVWIPIKYTGTYGDNGARLKFDQVGVGTASTSTIGADTSGNNNHWTSSGIVASDCAMPDSPENNFCTWNPLTIGAVGTLAEGNLKNTGFWSADLSGNASTFFPESGKWYWELRIDGANAYPYIGITSQEKVNDTANGGTFYNIAWRVNGTGVSSGSSLGTITKENIPSFADDDIISFALDVDARKLWVAENNTYADSGDPANGSGQNASWTVDVGVSPFVMGYNGHGDDTITNFGQDDTFAGAISSAGNTDGNGKGVFKYAPPSGFLALCTANLPEPTIGPNSATQSDDHFNAVLYSGTGSSNAITGVGFQPDWTWIKRRSGDPNAIGNGHNSLYDSNRGVTNEVYSDLNSGEADNNNSLTAFGTDGFTVGSEARVNADGETHVAWNWKANGGTTSTLTDGSIDTTVQANTTAGFSIMTFVSDQQNGTTLAHGLGAVPAWFILKSRDESNAFYHYHKGIGEGEFVMWGAGSLGVAAEEASTAIWGNTVPTTSVVTAGIGSMSLDSGHNIVGYAFAEVDGFSKFGSYTGNNATDGNFVFTNFSPALVIIKFVDGSAGGTKNWTMWDNKRSPQNVNDNTLFSNTSAVEGADSAFDIDLLSNGFKLRNAEGPVNNAAVYIYMAFAEAPFKYANAR